MKFIVCIGFIISLALSLPLIDHCDEKLSDCKFTDVDLGSHRLEIPSSYASHHATHLLHRPNPDFEGREFDTHAIARRSDETIADHARDRCPPARSWPTCPVDWSCERKTSSSEPQHKSVKLSRPPSWYQDPQEPSAVSGPQLSHNGIPQLPRLEDMNENKAFENQVEDQARSCPLERCDKEGPICGPNAICLNGYCACRQGFKAGTAYQGRGWDVSGAMNVFVNPRVPCRTRCGDESCSEVNSMSGCFRNETGINLTPQGQSGVDPVAQGQQELETVSKKKHGGGVVQVPGAAIDG